MSRDESYEIARERFKIWGPVPWTFVSAVRLLLVDIESGNHLSPQTFFQLNRLLKSSSVLAGVYSFVKGFYPEKFSEGRVYGPVQLASQLDPLTLSAVLTIIYLYRRGKRISPPEDWSWLAERFEKNVYQSVLMGKLITEVGAGQALLLEGTLHAGLAALLAWDRKGFVEYKKVLRQGKVRFDRAFEMKRWGCSCVEIGALTLTAFGLGPDLAGSFDAALNARPEKAGALTGNRRRFYLADRCMNLLQDPETRLRSAEGNDFEGLRQIAQAAQSVSFDDPAFVWLKRGKSAFNPAKMPGLSIEDEGDVELGAEPEVERERAQQSGAPPSDGLIEGQPLPVLSRYEDLPEAVRRQLSAEEFKQVEHLPMEEILALFME